MGTEKNIESIIRELLPAEQEKLNKFYGLIGIIKTEVTPEKIAKIMEILNRYNIQLSTILSLRVLLEDPVVLESRLEEINQLGEIGYVHEKPQRLCLDTKTINERIFFCQKYLKANNLAEKRYKLEDGMYASFIFNSDEWEVVVNSISQAQENDKTWKNDHDTDRLLNDSSEIDMNDEQFERYIRLTEILQSVAHTISFNLEIDQTTEFYNPEVAHTIPFNLEIDGNMVDLLIRLICKTELTDEEIIFELIKKTKNILPEEIEGIKIIIKSITENKFSQGQGR